MHHKSPPPRVLGVLLAILGIGPGLIHAKEVGLHTVSPTSFESDFTHDYRDACAIRHGYLWLYLSPSGELQDASVFVWVPLAQLFWAGGWLYVLKRGREWIDPIQNACLNSEFSGQSNPQY